MSLRIARANRIQGTLRPPSDKSLTHRAYMLSAIANGESRVHAPLRGEDCESTLRCLNQMGLRHEWLSPTEIRLIPVREWENPARELDCGNSGTTMRLISGLIASRPLSATLVGDHSLSRRPMGRIANPLRQMGAVIEGDHAPLNIQGARLQAIDYVSPVASAQVKSAILLAGLRASGPSSVTEPERSRDHTERMLSAMGAKLVQNGNQVTVFPTSDLAPLDLTIPADISSAAFFLVAAALLPDSELLLRDVSINPTRSGILDVFAKAGIPVDLIDPREELGEPVADLLVKTPSHLRPFTIQGPLVPRLIDEIPVLAVLATQCDGTTVIRDARELRVKETDRIERVSQALIAMGAKVEPTEDGMIIEGPTPLTATTVDSSGDHRLGMAFAIAGLIAEGETTIESPESIATSFPSFAEELRRLTHPSAHAEKN